MPIKTALACRGEQCSPASPQQCKNKKADAGKSSAFFSVIDNKPDMYYNIGIVKMNGPSYIPAAEIKSAVKAGWDEMMACRQDVRNKGEEVIAWTRSRSLCIPRALSIPQYSMWTER